MKMHWISAILVLGFALVGCGTKQKNLQGCNVGTVTKDRKVFYVGYRDDKKFMNSVDYVGTVLAVLADGYAEVEWHNAAGPGKTSVSNSSVKAENGCEPTRVGKRVLYTGYRDDKEFKNGTDYFGNVVTTFSDDYYQVKWELKPDEIHVHSGSSLKIE